MIRVVLSLISANGSAGDAKVGEIDIGNYTGILKKSAKFSSRPGTAWRAARVEGFERLNMGPYDLLFLILENALGASRIAKLHETQRAAERNKLALEND